MPSVSAIEGAAQFFEQELMIEWFGEKIDCTPFYGFSPYLGIVIRRNKDDGSVASLLFEDGLQLQTRHLRHADVKDQATGPAMQIGFEERFG